MQPQATTKAVAASQLPQSAPAQREPDVGELQEEGVHPRGRRAGREGGLGDRPPNIRHGDTSMPRQKAEMTTQEESWCQAVTTWPMQGQWEQIQAEMGLLGHGQRRLVRSTTSCWRLRALPLNCCQNASLLLPKAQELCKMSPYD